MKKMLLVLASLKCIYNCIGQAHLPPSSLGILKSGAYSRHFVDAFSIANPASLSKLKSVSAGVYGERKFLLEEMSCYAAVVGFRTGNGGIGIRTNYFGSSDYNESQLSILYGRSLGTIDIGIGFNYNRLSIAGYGSAAIPTFEVGSIWHMNLLHIGFHIYNPTGGKISTTGENLPVVIRVGIGYEPSEILLITAELSKAEDQEMQFELAVLYVFSKKFFASIGMSGSRFHPSAAIGIRWKNIRTDFTASFHPQLGVTPGLVIRFSKNEG